MTTPKFEELFKKLNAKQKEAVDAVEGPVMVIAGPGTGKTQILTLRIANIIRKTDTPPDAILALTFTEAGVSAMRQRLFSIIGVAAYRVHIHTFHSFCNEVIKTHPQEFLRILGSQHMTDVDQVRILEDIIEKTELENLRPAGNPYFYLKAIIGSIRELKRENISPETLVELIKKQEANFKSIDDLYHDKGKYKGEMKGAYQSLAKKIENNKELTVIYEAYEMRLREERFYDFEDMLMETVRVLEKNSALLLTLQESYHYILADEHQDANMAQNRLLELLSSFHQNPNIFIVGDEKQAIFRFQGASLENFLYFKRHFPGATLIELEENYRSPQQILDLSHGLIGHNGDGLEKRVELQAMNTGVKDFPRIELWECGNADTEPLSVVDDISRLIKEGVAPEAIAVLYRDNKDAEPITAVLEKAAIPYARHSDSDVFADPDIGNFLALLRAVNRFGDDALLAPALFINFLGLNHLDVFKIIEYAKKERVGVADVLSSPSRLLSAMVEEIEKCVALYNSFLKWSNVAKNKGMIESMEAIKIESGFLAHLIALPDAPSKLALLSTLIAETENIVERHKEYKLSDFIFYLETLALHELSVKSKTHRSSVGRVNVMTAHKSKGLEFEYVYIMGVVDGKWGGRRAISYFDLPLPGKKLGEDTALADERRLLYVALTRAKERAILSWYREKGGREFMPSQFIEELRADLVVVRDLKNGAEHPLNHKNAGVLAAPTGPSLKDRAYLREIFLEKGLSVSALNNFLECPWRYFFVNLIAIPQAKEPHQLYGTAVHEALKDLFDALREDKKVAEEEFILFFENHLSRKHLSDADFARYLKKGRETLRGYYHTYKETFYTQVLTEFSVRGILFPVEVAGEKIELVLKGNLDKMEILPEGSVNVVDYKTGASKTRNDIEGKTKSSKGDIKRQLVFYKLLLDRYGDQKYNMASAEVDFIEPDARGNYHKEKFVITDEEVVELEGVIAKAAQDILSFSFWDSECDNRECEWCELKNVMK